PASSPPRQGQTARLPNIWQSSRRSQLWSHSPSSCRSSPGSEPIADREERFMRRFTRLGASAVIAVGSLATVGAFSLPPAHALGPEGCAAQNNNGALAVGTVTGTTAPAPPSNSP